jgi:hypothetical protein
MKLDQQTIRFLHDLGFASGTPSKESGTRFHRALWIEGREALTLVIEARRESGRPTHLHLTITNESGEIVQRRHELGRPSLLGLIFNLGHHYGRIGVQTELQKLVTPKNAFEG